jgi:hypothetical protein
MYPMITAKEEINQRITKKSERIFIFSPSFSCRVDPYLAKIQTKNQPIAYTSQESLWLDVKLSSENKPNPHFLG